MQAIVLSSLFLTLGRAAVNSPPFQIWDLGMREGSIQQDRAYIYMPFLWCTEGQWLTWAPSDWSQISGNAPIALQTWRTMGTTKGAMTPFFPLDETKPLRLLGLHLDITCLWKIIDNLWKYKRTLIKSQGNDK